MLISDLPGGDMPWHPLADGSPWAQLPGDVSEAGRPFYYYASQSSTVPCRDVMLLQKRRQPDGTRWADNKGDPNLETLTYGMWSSCRSVGRRHFGGDTGRYAFFYAPWPEQRVFSGFYDVGWTFDSWYLRVPEGAAHVQLDHDRFLAAREAHFVADPLDLQEVADVTGCSMAELRVRYIRTFSVDESVALRDRLLEQQDATEAYVRRIGELETRTFHKRGLRYVNWGRAEPLMWPHAEACFGRSAANEPTQETLAAIMDAGIVKGQWRCLHCETEILTPRPIKNCSHCTDGGIMVPITEGPWEWVSVAD